MMTKRMYAYYRKQAAAAGTTVLVYLRREFRISDRRPLKVVAVDTVEALSTTPGKEASG